MPIIQFFWDFIFHLDAHLSTIIQNFGTGTYLLLFAIIFAETGLVITPFLPGDSLLFAVGAFAAKGDLSVMIAFFVLTGAAIIGDSVNYAVGSFLGPQVFHKPNARFLKKEYLRKTHEFYEKYGAATIVIARFVPIVRTFAPFVAGVGRMSYWKFLTYNIVGALIWVTLLVFAGYFFGNIPWVKENFSVVVLIIIFISILPIIVEYGRHYYKKWKK